MDKNDLTYKKAELRRARTVALVLASATVISLIFLVFAFVQKDNAERLKAELLQTRQELQNCQQKK